VIFDTCCHIIKHMLPHQFWQIHSPQSNMAEYQGI
jgi:hypothetical protein